MFEVALHRKRIPESIQSNLLLPPLRLKLKKLQGLFKDFHRNSRAFQGQMEFKDFLRLREVNPALSLEINKYKPMIKIEWNKYHSYSYMGGDTLWKVLRGCFLIRN